MNSLSELVRNYSKSTNVQISLALPMTPKEASWLRFKEHIKSLPIDISEIIKKRLQEKPSTVKIIEYEKNSLVSIEFPEISQEYRLILEVAESKKDGTFSARYVAIRQDPFACYIHHFLGKSWFM